MRRLFEWFLERPFVYATWQAPFADQKFAPVERSLRRHGARRVLDVGCGPGTNARRFAGADYVGVDVNEQYLAVARSKYKGQFVQADLATADLSRLGRFDTVLVNSVLHHLPDASVVTVLGQCKAVLAEQGRIHILELVLPEHASIAFIMARLDRGRYARTIESWQHLFEMDFEPLVVEPYSLGGCLWSMLYFQGGAKRCDSP